LVTLRFPGKWIDVKPDEQEDFLEFVKVCFSQKRKTLVNSLKSAVRREPLREAMAEMKLRPDARAEQLAVTDFVGLWRRTRS
jgi:16S rRNA A1518/A1519 N6-dimethyltransferase RsmA/KsgA/DIM1 with predicted DNA glycosylase/AP lyase activity